MICVMIERSRKMQTINMAAHLIIYILNVARGVKKWSNRETSVENASI